MRIYVYNEETAERITNYDSDIVPLVGDYYTELYLKIGSGVVTKRILIPDLHNTINIMVKVHPKLLP